MTDPALLMDADDCRKLAQRLMTFVADRRGSQEIPSSPPPGTSEEEQHRLWEEGTRRRMDHAQETMSRYATEFQVALITVARKLQRNGFVTDDDIGLFEHPTNPIGIEEVASRLLAIADAIDASVGQG